MLPLSFKEYVTSTGSETDLSRKYVDYLQNSSFPYALAFAGKQKEIHEYLDGVFNTIVVKDISLRKKITDPMMLKSILRFLFDNIGNPLSSKQIADTMTSAGRKIDTKTVEKYYVVDIGMRYMLLGSRNMDNGHILGNVIYLELLRRGYDVYVGKVDNLEVDFVATNTRETTYFQVSATVRDENTLARELRPLQSIHDHYPKYLLTLDDDPETDFDGICKINALNWLMGNTN